MPSSLRMTFESPANARERRLALLGLGAVCLAATALRLAWARAYPSDVIFDLRAYLLLARNLAETGVFGAGDAPQSTWPPGHPAFLAALNLVLGPGSAGAFAPVGAVFASVSLALTYALGRALGLGRGAALAAPAALAVYPAWLYLNVIPASENVFGAIFLAWTLAVVRLIRRPSTPLALGVGALWAAANLTRPVLYLPIFLVLVWVLARPALFGLTRRTVFVATLAALALTSVWTARNGFYFGSFIPVNSASGHNLYLGNTTHPDPGWLPDNHPLHRPFVGLSSEAAHRKGQRMALRYIARHPFQTLARLPRKVQKLVVPGLYAMDFNTSPRLGNYDRFVYDGWAALMWLVALFGAVAFFLHARRPGGVSNEGHRTDGEGETLAAADPVWLRQTAFLGWLLVVYVVVHLLFFTVPRFRYPIEPVCAVLAVLYVVRLRADRRRRAPKESAV